jgi:hypothetical protein
MAPNPVGSLELSVCSGSGIDALARLGQPRDDAACGKIDVQVHQLLGHAAPAVR